MKAWFYPPADVIAAARRGLELYEAGFGGRGLVPATVSWARAVARGKPIDAEKAVKGNAWHARHYVDRRPHWDSPPTPGYVANLLWFGSPGARWFKNITRELKLRDIQQRTS